MHGSERDGIVRIETDRLSAAVRTTRYVTGLMGGSFVDRATGVRDPGYGLLLMDFLLAPGWREDGYTRAARIHGNRPKHVVEGPLITTETCNLPHAVIRGPGFTAVRQWFTYTDPGAGYRAGSRWEQVLVFPETERFVLACETVRCVNAVDVLSYRMDVPGHVKLVEPSPLREVYLSYHGAIAPSAFEAPFAPDARFLYLRDDARIPGSFIRACRLAGPNGEAWLAGMTLDPAMPSEAWCHRRAFATPAADGSGEVRTIVPRADQRDYICFIQENHGRPVAAGQTIGAAYVLGYFDSLDEMEAVYDRFRGARHVRVGATGYRLEAGVPQAA